MKINQKYILWDFDGVIIDSNLIRTNGFKYIFRKFDSSKVDQIINYHNENGGLSRYHKIHYFFEEILEKNLNKLDFKNYLNEFSEYVINEILNNNVLINETLDYIKNNSKVNIIVSASDQTELRYLCNNLQIDEFFNAIFGSPTKKETNIKNILTDFKIDKNNVVYIGDSTNDYRASLINQIPFLGYNNESFKKTNINIISSFTI
jgi:phosphoglycolate phosphatase-like HAD superfamily hydrolase